MSDPATTHELWRTRPVFLTSTFRDMHAERDWLREHVMPELEERLRQRHCHLETIDLRWGVRTTSVDELHSKELLVLKVCLSEIERSRPFLIGLLGDRYGWVAPAERMQMAAQEAGVLTSVAGKSITALEIEFGALDSPDQRRRSHFYFRSPLPYQQMDLDTAQQFSELHAPDPQAQQRHDALQALKARIERQMEGRVHWYTTVWDSQKGEVTGLDAFGQMVLDDLWRDLEGEVPPLEQQPIVTWRNQEWAALEEFIERGSRDFVGRDDLIRDLTTFALSSDPAASLADPKSPSAPETATTTPTWAVSLTGPAGAGKSAVFCQLCRQLGKRLFQPSATASPPVLLLAHAAGISLRSTSVDSLLLRWIGELAGVLGVPVSVEENATAEELEAAFTSLLGRAAKQRRVVVLLDALNQFEPTVRAKYLTWLPAVFPANARLITTAIPHTASRALEGRPGVQARAVLPLNRLEAEEIAEKVCARYHRQLDPCSATSCRNARPMGHLRLATRCGSSWRWKN